MSRKCPRAVVDRQVTARGERLASIGASAPRSLARVRAGTVSARIPQEWANRWGTAPWRARA